MKTLKIKTLEKGWCDKDFILLHAAFQLLVDFVEQEKPDQTVGWNADAKHRRAWKEICSLYRWWTRARANRKDPLDEKGLRRPPFRWKKMPRSDSFQLMDYDRKKYAPYHTAMRKHARLEQRWHEEDQRNLHRLIDIRPFLWT